MAVRLVHHVALTVKAQDVIAHAAGTARLNLMLVTEELLPGKTTSIVQLSMGEDTQQSALPSIHITNHCDPIGRQKSKMWEQLASVQALKSAPLCH